MSINIKELSKQIKKWSRRYLIWTLEDGIHYVSDRHVAFRFNELPKEVLISLFSVFVRQPSEGRSLVMTPVGDEEKTAISMKSVFRDSEQFAIDGVVTKVVVNYEDYAHRVIQAGDYLVRVDEMYMKMANGEQVLCKGRHNPVLLCDGQMLLLPIRISKDLDANTIHEVLSLL